MDGRLEHVLELHDGRTARVRFTVAAEGDLRVDQPAPILAARRTRLLARPWTWLRQVHGGRVVTVTRPGEHAGAEADAAVTRLSGAALAIHAADCAPVGLLSPQGLVGAAHAGWQGLVAGVVEATVERMRRLGAVDIRAVLGPCIHPSCYAFGPDELDRLVQRYGPGARGTADTGAPALDIPACIRTALAAAGVAEPTEVAACTACDHRFFSHRTRRDAGRQAMLVWIGETEE